MQRLTVDHRTTYRYLNPVSFGDHRMMFRPRDSHDLRLLDATLTVSPQAEIRWFHDVFGNSVAVASFDQMADTLTFESRIVLERYSLDSLEFPIEEYAQTIPFSYPASEVPDLGRTIERHYPDPDRRVTEWTRRFLGGGIGGIDTEMFLTSVTQGIKQEFDYAERHEPGVQTPLETLDLGSGTCRDYALFMMEAVRSVGLAARFVSGYLYDPALDGGAGDIVGAGATHAWVQVYLPGAGWIEFDPTNGSLGGFNLVPIAVAREPQQAVPVVGSYEGNGTDFLGMEVDVSVHAQQMLSGVA